MKVSAFSGQSEGAPQATKASETAAPGIRLIDPSIVSDAFRQQQQISQYYTFQDNLDVDRYTLKNGSKEEEQDSVVAVRELNQDGLGADQRNWYNDHIVYTHGIGLVAAYGNKRGANGNPLFYEENIPPSNTVGPYQPRVYFGEESPDYSIVGGPKGTAARARLSQQQHAAAAEHDVRGPGRGLHGVGGQPAAVRDQVPGAEHPAVRCRDGPVANHVRPLAA